MGLIEEAKEKGHYGVSDLLDVVNVNVDEAEVRLVKYDLTRLFDLS